MRDSIHSVAVVGAGTMGQGIAQVCAAAGIKTLLYDVREEQAVAARRSINNKLSQGVKKGILSVREKERILLQIEPVSQLTLVKADLIIEAAVENLEVKQELFSSLEKINNGEAILATNTSSISITRIASGLNNPSVCIGLHFFNPADKMKLVEIISGHATSPKLTAVMKLFTERIGKTAVFAKDSPGFIVNRVARHFYVEALKLLEEKAADVPAIDALMRSAGFKMGPFELMDLIGLDTNLAVTRSVYEGFNRNPKFKPSVVQEQLVNSGCFGMKSGRGFYDYREKVGS